MQTASQLTLHPTSVTLFIVKSSKSFVIGSRGSRLAMIQAKWVQDQLKQRFPDLKISIHKIKVSSDTRTDHPLDKHGRKGLYTGEIEKELAAGQIDCAVHSMKDVPSELLKSFAIAAITKREDPRDAFVSSAYPEFLALPKNARVGTSSLRRATQLKNLRPDLVIVPMSGNVETRLKKLQTEKVDGIILAAAGLKRLGLADRITEPLAPSVMVPAAGQGSLAIEIRADDESARSLVSFLNDVESAAAVRAERACVRKLSGGCEVPITAFAEVRWNRLEIVALVATPDGREVLRDQTEGDYRNPEEVGEKLAAALLAQGAKRFIDQILAHVAKR